MGEAEYNMKQYDNCEEIYMESGMEKHRFVCEDEFDAMMSCIYEAWIWENRGFTVELAVESQQNFQLFCVEHQVRTDDERTEKVIRSIRKKISAGALRLVYYCAMSAAEEKLNVIYRFLRLGFAVGPRVVSCLTEEPVTRIHELSRKVGNETHQFREFTRFTEGEDGILWAVISPRSNVLTLLSPYFADRLPSENWMIVDNKRGIAALHQTDSQWYLRRLSEAELSLVMNRDRDSEEYAVLWRAFFRGIAISQRINPRCQTNFLPKWYRENMTEFR